MQAQPCVTIPFERICVYIQGLSHTTGVNPASEKKQRHIPDTKFEKDTPRSETLHRNALQYTYVAPYMCRRRHHCHIRPAIDAKHVLLAVAFGESMMARSLLKADHATLSSTVRPISVRSDFSIHFTCCKGTRERLWQGSGHEKRKSVGPGA